MKNTLALITTLLLTPLAALHAAKDDAALTRRLQELTEMPLRNTEPPLDEEQPYTEAEES